MANAYFCNCVADTISVNLNLALNPVIATGRATPVPAQGNLLPMVSFPLVSGDAVQGALSLADKNYVIIAFETLRKATATYDIQLSPEMEVQDLFFYVFENSLVGQTERGVSDGISINIHQVATRRVLQTGLMNEG